jgi:hypothetical protein
MEIPPRFSPAPFVRRGTCLHSDRRVRVRNAFPQCRAVRCGVARAGMLFWLWIGLAGWGAEVLPNGIVLPSPWPPHRSAEEVAARKPMEVPYLAQPPRELPVQTGRQLFVDDFLIQENTLTRNFHQPVYHPSSPVLRPEREWEIRGGVGAAAPYSDGVWYDSQESLFKMWYWGGAGHTCLAVSEDGIEWRRPQLSVIPGTNVVLKDNRDTTTVWLDPDASDPAERYKMFVSRTRKSPYHLALRVSRDGREWSEERAVSGPSWDRSTVFWNPFRKVWVASVRGHNSLPPAPVNRLRNYYEGATAAAALGWTLPTDNVSRGESAAGELQPWVGADRLDPRNPDPEFSGIAPQLYNLDVFAYESLLVGLFTIWQGPDNATCKERGIHKRNEVLVGFSRDGFHWDRTNRTPFLAVGGEASAWNAGNVQSAGGGCLVVGDTLYFYCSGRSKEPSDRASTGLAVLRRDGFASLDAGPGGGSVTTRPLRFEGGHLFVNARLREGELRAEVLDSEGRIIPGFGAAECEPVRGDRTRTEVRWRGGPNLAALESAGVRIRFQVRDGSLYAFWFSRDAAGASHGFVAAGGPGLGGLVDKRGSAASR